MASGLILVYGYPPNTPAAAMNRLRRALHGYKDRSNRARYTYDRAGLLTDTPHRILRSGVLLLPIEMGPRVQELVESHGAWVWARAVELTADETRVLYPGP